MEWLELFKLIIYLPTLKNCCMNFLPKLLHPCKRVPAPLCLRSGFRFVPLLKNLFARAVVQAPGSILNACGMDKYGL
jgi:hypothetical protein